MSKRIILTGDVQGVFCRQYCSQYGRLLKIRGSATNQNDGSVRVLLDTDDADILKLYIYNVVNNPKGFRFFGKIDRVELFDYKGEIIGDYMF